MAEGKQAPADAAKDAPAGERADETDRERGKSPAAEKHTDGDRPLRKKKGGVAGLGLSASWRWS